MHKYILLGVIVFAFIIILIFGHSKQVVRDLLDSLKAEKGGFSNTKLIGWVGITISGYISIHFTDANNIKDVLSFWLIFTAVAIGLVKVGDLIQLKTGQKVTETKSESASQTITEPTQPVTPKLP